MANWNGRCERQVAALGSAGEQLRGRVAVAAIAIAAAHAGGIVPNAGRRRLSVDEDTPIVEVLRQGMVGNLEAFGYSRAVAREKAAVLIGFRIRYKI